MTLRLFTLLTILLSVNAHAASELASVNHSQYKQMTILVDQAPATEGGQRMKVEFWSPEDTKTVFLPVTTGKGSADLNSKYYAKTPEFSGKSFGMVKRWESRKYPGRHYDWAIFFNSKYLIGSTTMQKKVGAIINDQGAFLTIQQCLELKVACTSGTVILYPHDAAALYDLVTRFGASNVQIDVKRGSLKGEQ